MKHINGSSVTTGILIGFVIGWFGLMAVGIVFDLYAKPAGNYTVAELTDAIATREANFAERAVELEERK